ncbi:MAG: lysK [Chloroflexi bacterium]|nr:lysK [Chloroflexota bacterium]
MLDSDFIPETLLGLVQRYSPTGQEQTAVTWLVARMKELGFARAFSDEIGNAVGIMGEGPRQVILLGHVDTVLGEIPVRIEDDVLRGRGAVDAKGPLAVFVDAVSAVGPIPGWQFVVIGAVDEEGDSSGAWHIVNRYRPELAVIGEPSGWERVTLGYRGGLWFEYHRRGPLSHTASGNESACEKAVSFWNRLKAECDQYNRAHARVFEQVTPTLHKMRSESDGFEEKAILHIGVRLPLGISPLEWKHKLDEMSAGGWVRLRGLPVPAYRAEKNTPLVRAFLAAIRAQGGQPAFKFKSGTADMNTVGPVWGCPLLAYGPGDSSLDHTPQEHLSLTEYRIAVQVLTHALQSLAAS